MGSIRNFYFCFFGDYFLSYLCVLVVVPPLERLLMKRLLILAATLLPLVSANAIDLKPDYKGFAVGILGSFVIAPNFLDSRTVAPGGGIQGDVFFSTGLKGKFAYSPSFTFWGMSQNYNGIYYTREVEVCWEINPADLKYFPTIASSVPVKPYFGLGGPSIIIRRFSRTYTNTNHTDVVGSVDPALNIFAGVDFAIFEKVFPFIEARAQISDQSTVRFTGGVSVVF